MLRPPFPKESRELQQQVASEEACADYLTAGGWPEGFAWYGHASANALGWPASMAVPYVPVPSLGGGRDGASQLQHAAHYGLPGRACGFAGGLGYAFDAFGGAWS